MHIVLYLRHQNQPTSMLFKPRDVNDGPHPNQIRDDRITVMHGSEEAFRRNLAVGGDAW